MGGNSGLRNPDYQASAQANKHHASSKGIAVVPSRPLPQAESHYPLATLETLFYQCKVSYIKSLVPLLRFSCRRNQNA